VPPVQIIKNLAQIEMRPFVAQVQLLLHRQLRERQFPFGRFLFLFPCHAHAPKDKRDGVIYWSPNPETSEGTF
jgi:hypothetical protein